jgi:hypothetical protein
MRPALQPPPDELAELRRRVDALALDLDDVRARLRGMEDPRLQAVAGLAEPEAGAPADLLPLIGRALLVLGGGFLVRALTEGGALSPRVGVFCGLAYALALVSWAQHGARHGRRRQGLADGMAAALVVFPLLWEAAARFGVLGGAQAAVALSLAAHALLAAAVVSGLSALAWAAALGAVVTACALLPATHALVPLALAVLLLAFTTRALARALGWVGLGWPALCGATVLLAAGVVIAARAEGVPPAFAPLTPARVIALALALPLAVLLASAVPRRDRGAMTLSGVVQVAAAVAVGYAAALLVAAASGVARGPLALLGLAAAAIALAWGEARRAREPVPADASALVALALAFCAGLQLLGPSGRLGAWSAAGAALCLARRSAVLEWTGGALLALAAVQAGVPTAALALAACALAVLARAGRPFGPRGLAYATLALAGLRLLSTELRQGRPAALFVAFAVYGAALIVTPRLLRPRTDEA